MANYFYFLILPTCIAIGTLLLYFFRKPKQNDKDEDDEVLGI